MELRASVADGLFAAAEALEAVAVRFRRASARVEVRHWRGEPHPTGLICRWCTGAEGAHGVDGRCLHGRITLFSSAG